MPITTYPRVRKMHARKTNPRVLKMHALKKAPVKETQLLRRRKKSSFARKSTILWGNRDCLLCSFISMQLLRFWMVIIVFRKQKSFISLNVLSKEMKWVVILLWPIKSFVIFSDQSNRALFSLTNRMEPCFFFHPTYSVASFSFKQVLRRV